MRDVCVLLSVPATESISICLLGYGKFIKPVIQVAGDVSCLSFAMSNKSVCSTILHIGVNYIQCSGSSLYANNRILRPPKSKAHLSHTLKCK